MTTISWLYILSSLTLAAAAGKAEPVRQITTIPDQTWGFPVQILLGLTALTLLPALVMSLTPFLRITLVLHFLRQAIGTQSAPSNSVLLSLALFLTSVVMQPVLKEAHDLGWAPYERGELSAMDAVKAAAPPIKAFLLRYARERDVQLFLNATHTPAPKNATELDLKILMPAYVLSELKTGFQIGAVLFLPFLIIDLLVAAVTLTIGMVQLPPAMISSPFKILLFVLVDGWNLVVGSLITSFTS